MLGLKGTLVKDNWITITKTGSLLVLASFVLLPILWVTIYALQSILNLEGWYHLTQDKRLLSSLGLSLFTGISSSLLAYGVCAWSLSIVFATPALKQVLRWIPGMLATPHVAFAIGLLFLMAPSGWLLRFISPWWTGFAIPPPWITTQDPWGFSLIFVLACKEIPFIWWIAATQLQRDDIKKQWERQWYLAQTLGYSTQSAFWRVIWPQLAPRLVWPMWAVLAYGITVVDVAMVIGPTHPPTLSVLAWQWINDAQPRFNIQGSVATGLLTLAVLLCAFGFTTVQKIGLKPTHWLYTKKQEHDSTLFQCLPRWTSLTLSFKQIGILWVLFYIYIFVLITLLLSSVAGFWPFPQVWPQSLQFNAWEQVIQSSTTLYTTCWLALLSSMIGLLWCIVWLELAPKAWERIIAYSLYLTLVLPGILWILGLYKLALVFQREGHWSGVLFTHILMVLPYMLITLRTAYLGFDPRYLQVSTSLGKHPMTYLFRVKWPLLRRSLASAWAVGFAVAIAQYLPTLYIGAGRFNTITTEAVALASSGQRDLSAAYGWLQFILPVIAFLFAHWLGKPRFKEAV
jgi:putative thiamine transport system permease protein